MKNDTRNQYAVRAVKRFLGIYLKKCYHKYYLFQVTEQSPCKTSQVTRINVKSFVQMSVENVTV